MILRWVDGRPLADAAMVAALYSVSERSVRRHCRPVIAGQRGRPTAERDTVTFYDALVAADELAGVAPRPERTLAALRRSATAGPPGSAL